MNLAPKYASGDVRSPRNSKCTTAKLTDLDFSEWWTDDSIPGCVYLHVPRRSDDTVHRVRCKHGKRVRLMMRKGVLCWLWEKKTPARK